MTPNIIFDLDGTLLDTLQDLRNAVNFALEQHELPLRSPEEVRRNLGNGIRFLVEHSVPEGISDEQLDSVFEAFRGYYLQHCQDCTQPYDGIMEMLEALHEMEIPMAIVSNKTDPAVQELCQQFFSRYIDVAIGESPEVRRKPYPDTVLKAMKMLDIPQEGTYYVGDSEVDMQTAAAAGLPCLSVLWGFRDRDFLEAKGASCFMDHPRDVVAFVKDLVGKA